MKLFKSLLLGLVLVGSVSNAQASTERPVSLLEGSLYLTTMVFIGGPIFRILKTKEEFKGSGLKGVPFISCASAVSCFCLRHAYKKGISLKSIPSGYAGICTGLFAASALYASFFLKKAR